MERRHYIIRRDGVEVAQFTGTEGDLLRWFHNRVSGSMAWALRYEGYSVHEADPPAPISCPWGPVDDPQAIAECACDRERSVAGVSNIIPACPVHGTWEESQAAWVLSQLTDTDREAIGL